MKAGAQKWVIHLVKKSTGVVVSGFVGSSATDEAAPDEISGL